MKSGLLLALRITTGLLLIIWGTMRAMSPEVGVGLSEKYYGGLISTEMLVLPLAWGQIALGALVMLGLFRKYVYPAQAVVLILGALAISKYLLDPLGLYLLDAQSRQILFFPSTTVAVSSLIIIFFKEFDLYALDHYLKRK